jgi:UDP-N-acetyl-D-mannosaminuronic acid dehydrogenase
MTSATGAWQRHVGVVGLGYVGLTLAVSFARAGLAVTGVEADPAVRESLAARRPTLYEPGVAALLSSLPEQRLRVVAGFDATPMEAVVICVGTPIDARTRRTDLATLAAAVDQVAAAATPQTLVVLRSTVPVGTTRRMLVSQLRQVSAQPLVAFCPERTIQGLALAELTSLPQIIGGLDERSVARARALFGTIAPDHVTVSSLEAAELVKLVGNAHTDLHYGFGNEVALIAGALGLDGNEVIEAANLRYPRPDLARPGYVGGSCLTKDPYLLMYSAEQAGYHPPMVAAARAVNEQVPKLVVEHVLKALAAKGRTPADAVVLVCGIAYKGRPETDDTRGSAALDVANALTAVVGQLRGHDYVVGGDRIAALGYQPVALPDGLAGADALVLLVDHPRYRQDIDLERVQAQMRQPAVIYDMWGELADELSNVDGVDYHRLGRG